MSLELLISCVGKDVHALAEKMNIGCDAIVVNQKMPYAYEEFSYRGHKVRAFSMQEKGVGLSRTTALQRASADLVLFGDEDIVYRDGLAETVEKAFAANPKADMLLFNVKVEEDRATYWNKGNKRVRWYNSGRYPAYAFALRTERMHEVNLSYHLWFGGGARYSNGEDSLFLMDCLKAGLKIYTVTDVLGAEIPRDTDKGEEASTWFTGYNEKFFYDRGVLYHYLYGVFAPIMGFRFLYKNRQTMCKQISFHDACELMKKGYGRKGYDSREMGEKERGEV